MGFTTSGDVFAIKFPAWLFSEAVPGLGTGS